MMAFICNLIVLCFIVGWFVFLLIKMGAGIENKGIFAKNQILQNFFCKKVDYKGERVTYKDIMYVCGMAFLFRIGIYLISLVFMLIQSDGTTFSFDEFLQGWKRWDAPNYISIAKDGYCGYEENGQHLFLVFFPLYPWLLKIVNLFISNWELSCLVLSTLAYCVGCAFFYALISEEYGKNIAIKSTVLLSVFPFAFFFGAMMTESLFFATMSAGMYYVRKHKWFAVGVIGILCSLCRVQGVLLLGVAGVEFLVTYPLFQMIREKRGKEFGKAVLTKGIFLLLIPIGNLIYFYINYKTEGNPFQFTIYQREHWYHTTTWFTNCLSEIIGYITSTDTTNSLQLSIWIPELVIFIVTVVVLFYGLNRHPLKYTALLLVYTLVNYSVTFLISGGRYMSCAFPLFIIIGEFCERHPKIYQWIIILSGMVMMIYLIGYINWKQIM